MSSEMRELLKKYETRLANFERLYGYNEQAGEDARWNRAHMLQCRDIVDDLRALLARTAAGADGAVAWLVRCRRTGRVVWSDPSRSTAEGYARQIAHRMPDNTLDTEVIPLHTHPQDASGDAELREFAQLVLHGIESGNIKSPLVTRKVDGDYKLESLYDIGVAAMQAKEAK